MFRLIAKALGEKSGTTDEDEYGKPVHQIWQIKNHKLYTKE